MAYGFGSMIEKLKKSPKKIVFTEGTDGRILEASSRLLASNYLKPVLVGNVDEIEKAAEEAGFNIRGAEIIDPENWDRFDEMVAQFCELRKSKGVTPEQAKKNSEGFQLLRNHAGKDGRCRCPSWRSYLLYSRYRSSGSSADQDKTGQQHCIFLLHYGS